MKRFLLVSLGLSLVTSFVLAGDASTAAPENRASGPATASATTVPATYPRRNNVTLTWAPEYMSNTHSFSDAQAAAIARRFDVVAAVPTAFDKQAKLMRQANGQLSLLAYSNAMFADSTDAQGLPETAFAHNALGGRIKSVDFGLFLMEPSSPQWRARAVSLCSQRMTAGHYDGCLLDMLTMAIFTPGYVTSMPIRPLTLAPYTETEWRDQMVAVGQAFQSGLPGARLVGNALGNAFRFWRDDVTSQAIGASLPGAQLEDFLRGAFDPVTAWPTAAEWLDNVNVINQMEAMGRTGFYSTKLWVGQTPAETAAWQSYAMASFLMAANGRSYFAFTPIRDSAGATGAKSPYTMPTNLGAPLSPATSLNGVYVRRFANGEALVNPGLTTVTVPLDGVGRLLDGSVVSAVTLGPHSGTVASYTTSKPALRARVVKKQSRRLLKLALDHTSQVTVRLKLTTGARLLLAHTWRHVAARKHRLTLRLPSSIHGGRALLRLTVKDRSGQRWKLHQRVKIPGPARGS